ncbi:hypothetical protein GLX27_000346 [Malassezia furfur]|uniref:Uncharacterized protein n=1 Tax=Malassezia furfur TaxID=55194 RepID=A0ABY8ELP0_MALFU|nr:hypothetical protein GLX27_000346 [Malassezia furfur]
MLRWDKIGVLGLELLVDILQARGNCLAHRHRERVATRLARLMIRILADDDDLDLFERSRARPAVDELRRRENSLPRALLTVQELFETCKTVTAHRGLQPVEPFLVHRRALQGERIVGRAGIRQVVGRCGRD